jgi:putative nucleotidyltransferase with HDIG domain
MDVDEEKRNKLEAVLKLVDKSEISSIKRVVSDILRITNDPRSNAMDLKKVIEIDPPLTARVLKLANSACYAPPRPISEIRHAILWIGSDSLTELALTQKVCQVFQKDERIGEYSRIFLWKHSVAVALFGRLLYRREFGEKGDSTYTAGLLHDLGIIVEDQFFQKKFKHILKTAQKEKKNLGLIENEVLGFDHMDVGKAISEHWRFPQELAYAIERHHYHESADEKHFKISSSLYLADCICQENGIGYGDSPVVDKTMFQQCLKNLDVKPHALDLIAKDVEQEIKRMENQGFIPT